MDRIFDTVIGFQVFRIRSTLIAISDKAYWLIFELKAISFDIGYRILDFETSYELLPVNSESVNQKYMLNLYIHRANMPDL